MTDSRVSGAMALIQPKQANRSSEKLALAFREEIKVWKLSRDEDILVRMFVACLSERMDGRDPADMTEGISR